MTGLDVVIIVSRHLYWLLHGIRIGIVVCENSLDVVRIGMLGRLLLFVQQIIGLMAEIVFRGEMVVRVGVLLWLTLDVGVVRVVGMGGVQGVRGHMRLVQSQAGVGEVAPMLVSPSVTVNHRGLRGVLGGAGGPALSIALSAVHAQVEVTVATEQRLTRPLTPLTIGLESGDTQDLLASVMKVVMVEVRKVRLILVSCHVRGGGSLRHIGRVR